jgi:predicted Zn-dependent protease
LKSGKRAWIAAGLLVCGAAAVRGELETWVQHVPAGPAIAVLFRSVAMPGGAVPVRRPPSETRPALAKLISAAPGDAMLYGLRAQEAEMALDFSAAEGDWKSYVQAAAGSYAARIELADFYHRRLRPRDEIAALLAATAEKDDPLLSAADQRAWHAFERMSSVISEDALPTDVSAPAFRAWVSRYPKEPAARRELIEYLTRLGQFAAAEKEIAVYGRGFHDELGAVRMRAEMELERGSADAAIRVYDQAFQPLWPDDMSAAYFKLLESKGRLREFLGRARSAVRANATDLDATARLFHYFRAQNNPAAAHRALIEYRLAKESGKQAWTANELETLAQLFEREPDVNEAARLYYALYSMPPAGGGHVERSLHGLAHLLLTAPEQPIRFGSGDLSFYKDIATVDPSPGFLNGILSLILNSTGPRWEYERQDEKSAAYFHRAAASQLVALLDRRFPRSGYRAPLHAALVSAYATYGDNDAVIRGGRAYLAAFPVGHERFQVGMLVADALARQDKQTEEFALYDQFLRELAARARGVPIGDKGASAASARSPEYVQLLERYLSRLAALHRSLEALRVYRAEIDRNPEDPGLYERLAGFLDQNGMSRDIEDTYRRAIAKFPDRSWYHKLARWYLRTQQSAALEKITREAVSVFSGSELETYFGDIVAQTNQDAVLYRQLNLYAHERFPEDLVFVRNLLSVYWRKETYDEAATERLLRQYWFYDPQLRSLLFSRLSQRGRLYPELAEIRKNNPEIVTGKFDQAVTANPGAVQFAVEAEAWLCHFEAAAPGARALAAAYPGSQELTAKAAGLYRSLAAYFPADTEIAAGLVELEYKANPRNANTLAWLGDIFADREMYARARPYWEKMPGVEAGKPEAYLETATVYWDYYLYNDAFRWIAAARTKFKNPSLFAYQAGAIYEGQRDFRRAAHEYLEGAMDGAEQARQRLIRLGTRTATRDAVEQAIAAAIAADSSWAALSVRAELLEAQQRRKELEDLLRARVELEKSQEVLNDIQEVARRQGFDAIEERASERQAAVTNDPVDKMRLTLATARLYEAKKDIAAAAKILDALYRDNPLILGVIRGVVDFHVRNRQSTEAIGVLLAAAKQARPDLGSQFTLEAARIATNDGRFDQARALLTTLLGADPYRPEYLAAMAETYLRAKDDRGFRDYELAIIEQLKSSPFPAAERIARISTVRRSLIPALDRLADYPGAVAQYIELIDNYPEDEGLTREAASYAVAHGEIARMTGFYRKTMAEAPRDYRWPIVLGRVETVAEDYPAAIADYERALKARPDRSAIVEAKARLEERLMRFEDAIKSYTRLYEMTYRDPQWLVKVAELQARCGRPSDAVAALRTAIVGARNETESADFEIAGRLESWHMLPEAVEFAERGARLAGDDLFVNQPADAMVYSRIVARARRMDRVLSRLRPDTRISGQLAEAAGAIIAQSYTPEEKASFEQTLTANAAAMPRLTRDAVLLPFATYAGLADLEARWRYESMTAAGLNVDSRFTALQPERGLYAELGRQLEQYAQGNAHATVESAALNQAARAFVSEGDIESQLRTMRRLLDRSALGGELLERYLDLLARRKPDDLIAIARGNSSFEIRNRAVQFAIASGQPQLAYSAVRARGGGLTPVWTNAYTALAGVYFEDRAPAIDQAFAAALDTRTIGERVQARPTSAMIVGANWFYYGARYGEYLSMGKDARAESYLPARLEGSPWNPDAYLDVGDFYAETGQGRKAIAHFDAALQLDADRADAHDRAARVLWSEGRREEAVARWKDAIAAFVRVQSRGVRVPESFWTQVGETFADIGQHRQLVPLRAEIEHQLRDYIGRNGAYRLYELLESAAKASLASGEDPGWLLTLSDSTGAEVIESLIRLPELTEAQRISLARDRLAFMARTAASLYGENRTYYEAEILGARLQLISMLLDAGDVRGATAEWNLIPEDVRTGPQRRNELVSADVRLASRTGTLDQLMARYRARPQDAPPPEILRAAAQALGRDRDENGARAVLEFVYGREIDRGRLDVANFLGLAGIKLEKNDTASALALLNRMALVADDAFDTLLPAAGLLAKHSRNAEAADFLERRVKAMPWDSEAKLRLAGLKTGPERRALLAEVVADSQAVYKLRAEAASANRGTLAPAGSELALLTSGTVGPAAASKPYFVESRIVAARTAPEAEARSRLWREALAIDPADDRARLGAVETALTAGRDSFALAAARGTENMPDLLSWARIADAEQAQLAASLAAAAERLKEWRLAQAYLRFAINHMPGEDGGLEKRLKRLEEEQERRAKDAARRPVVRDVIDQDQVVRPRIAGGNQ